MSNFQEPKKQFKIDFHTFAKFLMANDYTGEIEMCDKKGVVLHKGELYIEIPYMKTLSKEAVIETLKVTSLTFSDVEEYLEHLERMKLLDELVDASIIKNTES